MRLQQACEGLSFAGVISPAATAPNTAPVTTGPIGIQEVDVREIAQRLGVRFVLEGSLRKAGARVRINAQLIDGTTGGHIWADRYDGALDDVFELQDEVYAEVAAALSVTVAGR